METISDNNNDRKKSSIITLLVFLLLLILLVIPLFSYQIPPPEIEGVLISFGQPNVGSGSDAPKVQKEDPSQETTEEKKIEEKEIEKEEKIQEVKQASAPKPAPSKKILTSKIEKEVIVKKNDAEDIKAKQLALEKQQADAKAAQLAAAQAAAEKAARAAAAAAAAKQAKFDEAKAQFGEFLTGKGKGETATAGNQGAPSGDPNAKALQGISRGSGRVGGGLSDRGLVSEPDVKDKSQETGKIVMKVCVNGTGKVTSADFTQRGSTSLSANLIKKAKDASYKYTFSPAEIEEQCGTITYNFTVE